MKVMGVSRLLNLVENMTGGNKLIYFTGAFAFHKSIHEDTQLGYKIEGLSALALILEEEEQIFLITHRKEDFLYDYVAIRRKSPPPIPNYIVENVTEAQDAFDSNNGIQGLGKIRSRPLADAKRLRAGEFR